MFHHFSTDWTLSCHRLSYAPFRIPRMSFEFHSSPGESGQGKKGQAESLSEREDNEKMSNMSTTLDKIIKEIQTAQIKETHTSYNIQT